MSDARDAYVYRFFDMSDRLLYVGCTEHLKDRLSNHARKPWFSEVARTEVEHFPLRAAALQAEARAIQRENPAYNKVVPAISEFIDPTSTAKRLSFLDIAAVLRCSYSTIEQDTKRGLLNAVYDGKQSCVLEEEAKAYIAKRKAIREAADALKVR